MYRLYSLLLLIIINSFPIYCYCQSPDYGEFNLDSWFEAHPRVKQAIKWNNNLGILGYDSWSTEMKNQLEENVRIIYHGDNLEVNDVPSLTIYTNEILRYIDGEYVTQLYSRPGISEDTARKVFLSHIAFSIAADQFRFVPWRLDDLSNFDLDKIFDSRYFVSFIDGQLEGEPVNFFYFWDSTPEDPVAIYQFLIDNNLLGIDRLSTTLRLLEWCSILRHHSFYTNCDTVTNTAVGSPEMRYLHWHYRGAPPVSRVISGTYKECALDPSREPEFAHYTEGCHGTVGFLKKVLHVVNIPVERLISAGHATANFSYNDLILPHGDDPYKLDECDHRVSAMDILIDTSEYAHAISISENSSEVLLNLIYRYQDRYSAKHLPNHLLTQRCFEISQNIEKENSSIYNNYFHFYTIEDLDSLDVWNRLNHKIDSLGGCFNDFNSLRPPPREDADILKCWFLNQAGEVTIDLDSPSIYGTATRYAGIDSIVPHFILSEGATSVPLSGTLLDFSETTNVISVVSEDQNNTREWVISIDPVDCDLDTTILVKSICEGESYREFDQTGIYYLAETSQFGCDSIIRLDLTVHPVDTTHLSQSICEGESFREFDQTGIYYLAGKSQFACDSIIRLDLTVHPVDTTHLSQSICEGESFLAFDQTGIYFIAEINQFGCDSIIRLDLTVHPVDTTHVSQSICEGESYREFDQTGIYYIAETSQFGCDSIIELDLDVVDLPQFSLGHDTTIYLSDTLLLTAPGMYSSYLWQDGSFRSNYTIVASNEGLGSQLYWLRVDNEINCYFTDSIHVIIDEEPVSLNPVFKDYLKIYPNPSRDILNIETGISSLYSIEITSINGKLILSREMEESNFQLDLSSFQNGVYFITIRSKDILTTKKIIMY